MGMADYTQICLAHPTMGAANDPIAALCLWGHKPILKKGESDLKLENLDLLGQETDVSAHFYSAGNTLYYPAAGLEGFDPETLCGTLRHDRLERKVRLGFNAYSAPFENSSSWNFPPAYEERPGYPLSLSFPAENILRLRVCYEALQPRESEASLMLEGEPGEIRPQVTVTEEMAVLSTAKMRVELRFQPFSIAVFDMCGKLLTRTLFPGCGKNLQNCNPFPFSYLRRLDTMEKFSAVSLSLSPGEHLYGCGESFTAFDKRGQKLHLWTKDPHGCETRDMYKPVPFYQSSRGYGVFLHTSAPVTLDLGYSYQEAQTAFIAGGEVDLFIMVGRPKQLLASYTALTGRSPLPPLWSFGLWMSRITYKSEQEARQVAAKLREQDIPCDVIHLDTGWFENDWRCDYEFSPTRFENPQKMIADLKEEGFHLCLWQLPYFTPANRYYREILEKGYAVCTADGLLPTDDAVLDLSNPEAVAWYQEKLEGLLGMGVAAIKADFGEAAPVNGLYHSGRSGRLEHNLYPLRYNRAVSEVTKRVTGSPLIWARSAWAGSQRYPVHWGGDAENTDMGMLSSLRAGLSLGMCGFSFWSSDIGGFARQTPEEIYRRWGFMGIFTSHMRCHGAPPKEPWAFSEEFLQLFREQMRLRYRLTPYVYAQAALSCAQGLPVMRAMVLEYPDDPACLTLEDQYLFGEDILVAPLFEEGSSERPVYLPQGLWKELLTGQAYEGGRWHTLPAGALCGIALVRGGAVLPVVEAASCTGKIDWSSLRYRYYAAPDTAPHGWLCLPGEEPRIVTADTLAEESERVDTF